MAELPSWKGRHEEKYLETLLASPVTAKLVEGNRREGKLLGLLSARYFFREAAGPGFALVGDAGLHKDPTPGFGITDALRDARSLGRAILTGDDAALVRYWRQRDVDSMNLFQLRERPRRPELHEPSSIGWSTSGRARSPESWRRLLGASQSGAVPVRGGPRRNGAPHGGWGCAARPAFGDTRVFRSGQAWRSRTACAPRTD